MRLVLNALSELEEYLKQKRIGLSGNKMQYKGKRVGTLQHIGENDFVIQVFTQFDGFFSELLSGESDAIKKIAEPQIIDNNCPRCIDGKCSVTGIKLTPDCEEIEKLAERLLALRCEAIDNDRVPKCNYIKLSDRDKKVPCNKCKTCNQACRSLKNF